MKLLITTRDGETHEVPLSDRQRLTLGRFHENDVYFFDDRGLSRWHLALEKDGDGWTVADVGSRNGTFVNGVRVEGKRRLLPGDVITAGRMSALFTDATWQAPAKVEFTPTPTDALEVEATVVSTLDGALASYASPVPRGPATPAAGAVPARMRLAEVDSGALRALVRAGLELAVRRPLPELFSLILDLAMEVVGARRGVVLALEKGELVAQALKGGTFRISTVVRDRVVESRQSMLVVDTRLDSELSDRVSIAADDVRSLMAVPLQTVERVIGLIYVDWASQAAGVTKDALDLLTVFGNIAATRVEQERLQVAEEINRAHEQELAQAAEIQRGLQPDAAPRIEGLQLAGSNMPCLGVGGDYFDFIPLERGEIALMLGDVSGKGMPAALLMVDLRARIQVLSAGAADPARLMETLDRHMEASCPPGRYVTFFLAVVDPVTGRVRYCNAGHHPAFVVRRDGRVERLDVCGAPLGLMPGSGYESRACHLDRGDLLVLYSDGVTEALDPEGRRFGDAGLGQVLLDGRDAGASAILDGITGALQQWTQGVPLGDDATLLVAKRD